MQSNDNNNNSDKLLAMTITFSQNGPKWAWSGDRQRIPLEDVVGGVSGTMRTAYLIFEASNLKEGSSNTQYICVLDTGKDDC